MRRASLRAALTAALMVGGMATTAAPAAHAADNTGLIASFGITSTWGAGFEGGYTVTNKSTHTVTSWTITFTLPATEAVTSSWNGTLTHTGTQYTITSPPGRPRSPPVTPRPWSAWTSATAAQWSRRAPA